MKLTQIIAWVHKRFSHIEIPIKYQYLIGITILQIIHFNHAAKYLIETLHNRLNTLLHLFNTNTTTIITISYGTYKKIIWL